MADTPRQQPHRKEDDVGLFLRPRRNLLRVAAGRDAYDERAAAAYEAVPAPPPPAYAAPAAGTDTIAELEKLARLHESGALSDEEFAAAKARVLGA
jgi:hypothetical protein